MKIVNEKTFSYILNGSFKFFYNKLFLSSPADSILMLIKMKEFLYKFKMLCNPFIIYSIIGKSLDAFLTCDMIDYYIEKKRDKKITLESIKMDIEKKFKDDFLSIPVEYLDLYLNVLEKKGAYIMIMNLADELEQKMEYRYLILTHKYKIFKTLKILDKAYAICEELLKLDDNSKYWFEMANLLKDTSKYDKAYHILKNHINENDFLYWKLRAELAEFIGNYEDAVYSWKNVARCNNMQFYNVLQNIRSINSYEKNKFYNHISYTEDVVWKKI